LPRRCSPARPRGSHATLASAVTLKYNSAVATASGSKTPWWFALLGLGRVGRVVFPLLLAAAGAAFICWKVLLPGWSFTDQDERLFRAARHGDVAGIAQALAAGAHIDAASPVDGKTALARAAIFGRADAVRTLIARGADASVRGTDGRTALDVATAARADETDPGLAHDLDAVIAALRTAGSPTETTR
jgi:hypothetical protein